MSEMSVKEALMTLTKLEATILKKKCDELKYEEIGKILNYSEVTITLYMSNVYTKLGIDKSLHWTKRVEILREIYCPALADILQGREVEDIDWPIKEEEKPNPELLPIIIEDEVLELAQIEDKERTKPLPPLPQPTTKIDIPKEEETPRRFPWLATTITVLCIGATVIAFIGYRILDQLNLIPSPTARIALVSTSTLDYNYLKTQAAKTIQAQMALNKPEPTTTRIPTNTPIPPTNTPLPILTNTPFPLPFTDEFNKKDIDPLWRVVSGKPIVANDLLINNDKQDLLMYVGNDGWQDYIVNVVGKYDRSGDNISIVVRVQDPNNFIAFRIDMLIGQKTGWFIVENGEWNMVPETNFFTDWYEDNSYTVTVKGDEFTAVANQGSSYFILPSYLKEKYSKGGAGLYLNPGVEIDFFRLHSIP